jgi:hypothetical protein
MHTRIIATVTQLKKNLSATKIEMKWMCKGQTAQKDLTAWVAESEKLLKVSTTLICLAFDFLCFFGDAFLNNFE